MTSAAIVGFTLDTGALLAVERGDGRVRALLRRATDHRLDVVIPVGVVAQAWRGGPRQAQVARLLNSTDVEIIPLDDLGARAVGVLCGRSGHPDVVDVHVGLVASQRGYAVLTSDPRDIAAVGPSLRVIAV